jgi:hypothetical protein
MNEQMRMNEREPIRRDVYVADREDLLGEVSVLAAITADALTYLEQGDTAAAKMVLESWWLHACGHPEVEEDRPVYECRVCQDPATKRMMARWAASRQQTEP